MNLDVLHGTFSTMPRLHTDRLLLRAMKVGDWQDDRNYYANRYDAAYNNDFNNYTANVSNQQWKYEQQNGNSQWRQQQNASNYWQNKDYQLSKKAKAAAAAASKKR